jgi:membrane protease YdiL (CAAX protease family)
MRLVNLTSSELVSFECPGERIPNVFSMSGLFALAFVVSFGVSAAVGKTVYAGYGDAREAYYNGLLFRFLPFLLLVGCLYLIVRYYERRPFHTIGFPEHGWTRKSLVGILAGFGMLSVVVGGMALLGDITFEKAPGRLIGAAVVGSSVLFFLSYIVQSGAEETLFRGWILQQLSRRYRLAVGFTASMLIFGLLHLPSTPMTIINLTLFAVFATLYALREGSIWGVCGWHAAWNWTQGSFYGLQLTGHGQMGGTVLHLKATGPDLISGGSYGPEASIICTFVFVVAISVLLFRRGTDRAA